MSRRYRYQQIANLAVCDGFEMFADRADVEAVNEWRRRFDDVPCLSDVFAELSACEFRSVFLRFPLLLYFSDCAQPPFG